MSHKQKMKKIKIKLVGNLPALQLVIFAPAFDWLVEKQLKYVLGGGWLIWRDRFLMIFSDALYFNLDDSSKMAYYWKPN